MTSSLLSKLALLALFAAPLGAQVSSPTPAPVAGVNQRSGVAGLDANSLLSLAQMPVLPGTTAGQISDYAQKAIAENHQTFTDGTEYWSAGPAYASSGIFIDDFTLTGLHNPNAFSASQYLNILNKFVAAQSKGGVTVGSPSGITTPIAGEFPVVVLPDGTSGNFYSGWDQHWKHASEDGNLMVPHVLYLYCVKVGLGSPACNTAYTANVASIKTAFATIPRDATYHMIQVTAGDEFVGNTLFYEYMRDTGIVAQGNVWLAHAEQVMAQIATASGDSANASFFTGEQSLIVSGLNALLVDSASGLLKAATGQNSANLDVQSSALWASFGYATANQIAAVANYFSANYATLANASGFVLNTPGGWNYVGTIPVSGGAPYASQPYTATQYQGGFWSHYTFEFGSVLQTVAPAKTQDMIAKYLTSASISPLTEYYNVGSAAPAGTVPNMETPQGFLALAAAFPSPAVSGVVVDTRTVTESGGGVGILHAYTSSNPTSTGIGIANTSPGAHAWTQESMGSASGGPGHLCFHDLTTGAYGECSYGASATTAVKRFGSQTFMQWMSGAVAYTGSVVAGISYCGTSLNPSLLCFDDATAQDGLGSAEAGYVIVSAAVPNGKPSTAVNDYSGGGRTITYGPNPSTCNPYTILPASSDTSIIKAYSFGCTTASIPVPLTAPSLSTGQAAAVGATCTVSGYKTLTLDGVATKIAICQ